MTSRSDEAASRRLAHVLLFNRFSLLVLGILISAGALELGLRVLFATRVGPEVLLFGTPYCCGPSQMLALDHDRATRQLAGESFTAGVPELEVAGYRKYGPGQTRLDYTAAGESFEVRINNRGFRGDDFDEAARSGVSRVVTLGASSTFGYRSPDHETYPVVMEQLLNQWLDDARTEEVEAVEVINLGVPHLWSGQIVSLLQAEALPLQPDVVTLYAGMNDSKPAARFRNRPNEYRLVWIEGNPSLLERAYRRSLRPLAMLSDYFVTASLIRTLLPERGAFDAEQLRRYSGHKVDEFIANVAAMRRALDEAGAVFIVSNQPAHHSSTRLPKAGVTYEESVAELRDKLKSGRLLTLAEISFLTHSLIMERLESWCRDNDVPFVDVISVLDPRRDLMASYIHLTPAANRIVGEALADEVWEQMFPGTARPPQAQ